MSCDICGMLIKHHCRCPLYEPPKTSYYCSSCGEGIYPGDRYIKNQDGDYRHYECVYGMDDLLNWLNCTVDIMDDNYD